MSLFPVKALHVSILSRIIAFRYSRSNSIAPPHAYIYIYIYVYVYTRSASRNRPRGCLSASAKISPLHTPRGIDTHRASDYNRYFRCSVQIAKASDSITFPSSIPPSLSLSLSPFKKSRARSVLGVLAPRNGALIIYPAGPILTSSRSLDSRDATLVVGHPLPGRSLPPFLFRIFPPGHTRNAAAGSMRRR